MARHRDEVPTQYWVVKIPLKAGRDDDLIALRRSLAPGTQSMTVVSLIRSGGLAKQSGRSGQEQAVDSDEMADSLSSWML